MATKKQQVVRPAIIEGSGAILKAIESIASRGKKLDHDIHKAALSVAVHAYGCGDITLAQRLIEALPKGFRRNALLAWLCEYGPFCPSEDGKSVAYRKIEGDLRIDAAAADPFWDYKQEPPFKPFDLTDYLAKAVTRAEKALGDTEHAAEHNVDSKLLAKLRDLIGQELTQ